MLAVVVFWTAMPASTCLLASSPVGQPDCCRAMAAACDTPQMGADNSCCQLHESSPAVVSVQQYSPGQPQQAAILPDQFSIAPPAILAGGFSNALSAPPPKFPPGGAFALRI